MASKNEIENHKRYVYLTDTVDEDMAEDTIKALFKFEKENPSDDIIVIINSYGGYVDSMWAIVDAMQMVSCPIHTLVVGKAMSAGSLILLSGDKGKRYSTPNSRIMIHQISGASYGATKDVEAHANEMKRMEMQCRQHIVKRTKFTLKNLDNVLHHDYFLTPKDAIKHGVIDKVVSSFSDLNIKGW